MKKFLLILMIFVATAANATTKNDTTAYRHEVRVGMGDAFITRALTGRHDIAKTLDFWTIEHIFVTYNYSLNHWLSVGGQIDVSAWGGTYQDFLPEPLMPSPDEAINLTPQPENEPYKSSRCVVSIMPSVRFTYYQSKWVKLHAEVAFGVGISDAALWAGYVTPLGISVGRNGFFGTFEVGQFFSGNPYSMYNMFDRILNLSVGYRF